MKSHVWRRTLFLATLAASLAVTGSRAVAARGGTNRTPVTIVFDDLDGHAIRSDGLGAYGGTISSRDGTLVAATGDRSLVFDFGWADGPQEIADVTITVSSLDGDSATVDFDFFWFDFYHQDDVLDEWLVTMTVSVTRSGDTYHLTPTSDAELWWNDLRGRRFIWETGGWHLLGTADLPWGAVVSP